jgi:hypothetical protein
MTLSLQIFGRAQNPHTLGTDSVPARNTQWLLNHRSNRFERARLQPGRKRRPNPCGFRQCLMNPKRNGYVTGHGFSHAEMQAKNGVLTPEGGFSNRKLYIFDSSDIA